MAEAKKSGHPSSSQNKAKAAIPPFDPESLPEISKCTKCGKIEKNPDRVFYKISKSTLYTSNRGYCHLCRTCVDEIFEEYKEKYKDEKASLILTCCAIDLYFSEDLYNLLRDKGTVNMSTYIRYINGSQYKQKNTAPFLIELLRAGGSLTDENILREDRESRWTADDKRNKAYVIKNVGYDCFDDESYTNDNRKFLFNTLSGYMTDDVIEDPHKLQCIISMVKAILQQEQLDMAINSELRKTVPDYDLINQYSQIKTRIAKDIGKTANDNGISAKSNGGSARSNTALTAIMKEMVENNFEEIKVNVLDAKLSESYKEISEMNARALINELGFTTDEYARMLGEQSTLVRDQQDKISALEEELRLTKIALKEASGKDKGKT